MLSSRVSTAQHCKTSLKIYIFSWPTQICFGSSLVDYIESLYVQENVTYNVYHRIVGYWKAEEKCGEIA